MIGIGTDERRIVVQMAEEVVAGEVKEREEVEPCGVPHLFHFSNFLQPSLLPTLFQKYTGEGKGAGSYKPYAHRLCLKEGEGIARGAVRGYSKDTTNIESYQRHTKGNHEQS